MCDVMRDTVNKFNAQRICMYVCIMNPGVCRDVDVLYYSAVEMHPVKYTIISNPFICRLSIIRLATIHFHPRVCILVIYAIHRYMMLVYFIRNHCWKRYSLMDFVIGNVNLPLPHLLSILSNNNNSLHAFWSLDRLLILADIPILNGYPSIPGIWENYYFCITNNFIALNNHFLFFNFSLSRMNAERTHDTRVFVASTAGIVQFMYVCICIFVRAGTSEKNPDWKK